MGLAETSPNLVSRFKKSERARDALSLVGVTAIGLVANAFDKGALGVTPPHLVAGHALDVVGPIWHGYANRVLIRRNLEENTAVGFVACAATEVGQSLGVYGTFDPKDFVAYGVGTAIYYSFSRYRSRHEPTTVFSESLDKTTDPQ